MFIFGTVSVNYSTLFLLIELFLLLSVGQSLGFHPLNCLLNFLFPFYFLWIVWLWHESWFCGRSRVPHRNVLLNKLDRVDHLSHIVLVLP